MERDLKTKHWSDWVWDAWCLVSVIGIWPRFIEPNLLMTTRLSLPIQGLPSDLAGLKIAHFSDLHWHLGFSPSLARCLIDKVNRLNPDLIVFTGDFICCSQLQDPKGLKQLLCSFKAKLGCFAVLGNHDYTEFVTVNENGDYDVDRPSADTVLKKGFNRLIKPPVAVSGKVTEAARNVKPHPELISLLEETPFKLLDNQTIKIPIRNGFLNLCGLGEYSIGRIHMKEAFQGRDPHYPTLLLSHNPDSFSILQKEPSDIILMGHTHGGQVNLPWLWRKFTRMEYLDFKSGLKKRGHKWIYINRGIGSIMKFRWFAAPEIGLITLEQSI